MGHAVVGVLGHVNHGKTALVKALTGIDTDRLEEEKRRGMSIVLGFAHLALDDGVLDFVDVPGHEQFVRTMVAGATGIDATLLVVDGREGIKPQTVEHVAIAGLLGLRRGVVAVNKADLVEQPQRERVQQAVRRFLRGTHLEFAPVVFTSTRSGEGLPELRSALAALLQSGAASPASGPHFWLPLDRAFSLPGHGTVATGTLRGAALHVGDRVAALPAGLQATVRSLQVHNAPVSQAQPGQRVGVNLRGVEADALSRGDVLVPADRVQPTLRLDVELRLLPGVAREQVEGRRVRLLLGTAETMALPRVLGRSGDAWLAQLRVARAVVAMAGESFIVRRESPAATLGGGRVLDGAPRRHALRDPQVLARLQVLAGGSGRQLLCERLRAAGAAGTPIAELAAECHTPERELAAALDGVALVHERRAWALDLVASWQESMLDALRRFHREQPLRAGAPVSLCRASLPSGVPDSLCRKLLERLEQEQRMVRRDGLAWLAGHDPLQSLDAASRRELAALVAAFHQGGMQPPDPPAASAAPQRRALFELLVARGEVLLLPGQPPSQRIAFHKEALDVARRQLECAFAPPAGFTVSQARELLGSTRKFTVPLLQYLQASGHTARRGDLHVFVRRGGV